LTGLFIEEIMADEDALSGSAEPGVAQVEPEAPAEAPAEEAKPVEGEQPEAQEEEKVEGAAPEGDKAPDEAAPEEDERVQRRRQSAKERVISATKRAQAAEQARDDATTRAERAEARLAQFEQPAPRESDFESFDEYQAALTAHHSRQIFKEEREADAADAKADAESARARADAARLEAFSERQSTFAETTPDYFEAVNNPALPSSPQLAEELLASEKGPEVSYYLANHVREARRIAGMSDPRAVARAIGAIEGRLAAPQPKRISSAPEPVGAVATGSGSHKAFDPSNASYDEVAARLKAKGVIS
jgi:hypothetical protein